jgi:iron complex transport system substrate-binding protein
LLAARAACLMTSPAVNANAPRLIQVLSRFSRMASRVVFLATMAITSAAAVATPVRIVSQTVGSDELLLALAEPEQVAALSQIARERAFSAVAEQAKSFPQLRVNGDVEDILQHRPTLVLMADFSRAELVAQVRRAGVRVLIFDRYRTLEDAFENLRLLARELGPRAERRADMIIQDSRARVGALRERLRGVRRVQVLAPSMYGVIPGAETTFQDLCEHAGAENLAATRGGLRGHAAASGEAILAWPVEVVVLASEDRPAALAAFRKLPPYQFMAALRDGRVAWLEPWQLSCVSHHRVAAYEQLARALHPGVFR